MRYNRSKYGNKRCTVNGIVFDSIHEADRYKELLMLEKAGKIKDLRLQVVYELIPAQYETFERYSDKTGKRLKDGTRCLEKACSYAADFVYLNQSGELVVEDAKGHKTKEYRIKKKLMLHVHGIRIHEV